MIINDKRALAYIVTIDEIKDIPNYDRVEHARINGWWVIVSKSDNFKQGDKCVYFEVDSKVPSSDERFSFLDKRHYKVKTIKMCGVFSQGLIMPIAAFDEIPPDTSINTDVTDVLHIKYAVEEDNKRKSNKIPEKDVLKSIIARHKNILNNKFVKKLLKYKIFRKLIIFIFKNKKASNIKAFPTNFPYIHKTDEERVENMPWVLGYKNPLIVTEKLDGTSCTYILERKKHKKYEFYVTSRNVRQLSIEQECYHESNIYWELENKYHIYDNLLKYLEDNKDVSYVCIQGEGVGNVQGNPLKLKENDLYVFNFIDSVKGRYSSVEGKNIVSKWGMKWVPILDTKYMMPTDMEEFKEYATRFSVVNDTVLREGVVLRDPTTDLSFKNVSREYLLKH